MMVFRTNQYVPSQVGTVFSTKTQLYKLDDITGNLVEAGFQDDQELIQSSEDCALSKVLERFGVLPAEYLVASGPQIFVQYDEEQVAPDMFPSSNLNSMAQRDVGVEYFRQKYGFDSKISDREVLESVLNKLDDNVQVELDSLNIKKEEVVDSDEKKN